MRITCPTIIEEIAGDGNAGYATHCFETTLSIWNTELHVVSSHKKVFHRSRKNYQLALFDPDDGYYEYSVIATDLSLCPRKRWNFMTGRVEHEKVIGQLRVGLAFASVPTQRFGANSA